MCCIPATTTRIIPAASGTMSRRIDGTRSRTTRRRIVARRSVRAFDQPGTSPLDGKPLVSSGQDLASLRSLQDWYLRYQLTAVPNVAEVAPIGGFVKEYQVVLTPERLLAYKLPISQIIS